ncbi:hypothetical protein pipiens_019423 [Culex pipiens pipiens]|uniref:Transposable element P transposase n=1 Tax=Culex pipiens pipiens TaxID=38569 RepID=A0ABD1DUK3_CULPP
MLTIDGMAIKASLTFNAKSDSFFGFPSDGISRKIERNKTTRLATEAVVALVQGVAPLEAYRWTDPEQNDAPKKVNRRPKRFKQAVGYILGHHTVGSEVQKKFVSNLARALRLRGLYPVGLVLDQCSTNIKMVKESGATADHPVGRFGNSDLAIFYDNPHLLKNTKSMLMKYNAVLNGKVASFSHVVKLYELDCNTIPRLVPRLSEKCVYPAPFRAMNVAQAVRTMSGSTADGIEYHVDEGNLPLSALHTAQILRFFDQIFDTFNSKDGGNSVKVIFDME